MYFWAFQANYDCAVSCRKTRKESASQARFTEIRGVQGRMGGRSLL